MRVQEFSGRSGTQDIFGENIDGIIAEINYDINLLYVIPCVYTRNLILNHLRDRIFMLRYVMKAMSQPVQLQPQPVQLQPQPVQLQPQPVLPGPDAAHAAGLPAPPQPTVQASQKAFTLNELSMFDGKNGNPAYVAVNGIVYDVTDNAAWAAATHFGLTAGKDLSREFASCHAGQPILNKLKVVGYESKRRK